jgi:hypothetical protein
VKKTGDKHQHTSTNKQDIVARLTSFISKVCQIPPKTQIRLDVSSMNLLKNLRTVKRILFFDDSKEVLKYDLTKTALDLARLTNEIKGFIAVLESDFSERESQTFEYAQMEPQNRFVAEVLRQKKVFMEKYDRCCELFTHDKLAQYGRERDETIKHGRELLKEIEATYNKLPLSSGHMGL